ncbi:MAG TPA: DUF4349 domain-containing protein [Croceibacterium sp.]
MRKALILLAPVSLSVLAACGGRHADQADVVFDEPASDAVMEAAAAPEAGAQTERAASETDGELAALSDRPDIPLTLPKIAYAFDLGFRLAGPDVVPLQQEHADMCEALGPTNCQIVLMNSSGEVDEDIRGELQLAVAADKARGFAKVLSGAATQAGAEAFKLNIQGEELSKSLVDTEARLRSRIALRDRLLEVLETRRGKVEELVEAERSVAAVNEEIDAAQSWLREQRGRVAMSRMTVTYETATPGGAFLGPIESAIGSLGSIFGILIAVLIVLGAVTLPLAAGALGIKAVRKRLQATAGGA